MHPTVRPIVPPQPSVEVAKAQPVDINTLLTQVPDNLRNFFSVLLQRAGQHDTTGQQTLRRL